MNSVILHYAFIDESGTVGAQKGTNFFVIALAGVEQPRILELPVRRALKKYGRLSGGELKASNLKKIATERMLHEIAKQDVNIVSRSRKPCVVCALWRKLGVRERQLRAFVKY